MPDAGDPITPDDYEGELDVLSDRIGDVEQELATGLPRGVIGYAEQTSDVLTASATEQLVFGVAFNVAADRQVPVTAYVRLQGDAGDNLVIRVRVDGSGTDGDQVAGGSHTFETNGGAATMTLVRNLGGALELSEGAHELFVTQDLTAGSGIAGVKGSPEAASSIIVMDMGPG